MSSLFKYELRICCKMEKIKTEIFACFYNGSYMTRIVYLRSSNTFTYLITKNAEKTHFLSFILKENSLRSASSPSRSVPTLFSSGLVTTIDVRGVTNLY